MVCLIGRSICAFMLLQNVLAVYSVKYIFNADVLLAAAVLKLYD